MGFETTRLSRLIVIPVEEFEQRIQHMAPLTPVGWPRLLYRYCDDANLAAEVVACLAFKETGRFRYGGKEAGFSADPTFFNYGGIKTTDSTATFRFPTMAMGIRGLVAHVAWYNYPVHVNAICGLRWAHLPEGATDFDPRHWTWGHRAKLQTVADFGKDGIWNNNPDYGNTMVPLLEEFWNG